MIKIRKKFNNGFTLIETFVAVTILTIAIIGPLQMFSQSIADATYSKYQVTAFYLAAEGLDAVINQKDNNLRLSTADNPISWNSGFFQGAPASYYDVDVTKQYVSNDTNLKSCSNINGCYIYEEGGLYKSQSEIPKNKTPYQRKIIIKPVGDGNQSQVISTVTWKYKTKTNTTSLVTYISNI